MIFFLYFSKYDEDLIFIYRIKTCIQILESNRMLEDKIFTKKDDFSKMTWILSVDRFCEEISSNYFPKHPNRHLSVYSAI